MKKQKISSKLVVCMLALSASLFANSNPYEPSDLLTELQKKPLLVENLENPALSWIVNDKDKGEFQTAYRIVVSKEDDFLDKKGNYKKNNNVVWDSGKLTSTKSSGVDYKGPKLDKATRYYWSVQTWDKNDEVSPFSKIEYFDTALKDSWTASPIWYNSQTWKDYTMEFDVKIVNSTAGFYFRANGTEGYKYQFRSASTPSESNSLKKYIKTDKGTKMLGNTVTMPAGVSLKENSFVHVKIDVKGNTFTTFVNGTEVDKTIDDSFKTGTIGIWAENKSDNFRLKNLTVKASNDVLYENKFNGEFSNPFTIGTVAMDNNELNVGLDKSSAFFNDSPAADCIMESNWAFFRKSFKVENKPIEKAVMYAAGDNPISSRQYVYRVNLNGKLIGLGPARGYDGDSYYNAFDITSSLVSGSENVIGVTAFSYDKKKSFMSELRITYKDGTSQVIKTDDTWKVMDGREAFPYLGDSHHEWAISWVGFRYPSENIVAKNYPFGFDSTKFDDSKWTKPTVADSIKNLTGYPASNLEEINVNPMKVTEISKGTFVIDFGSTVVGGLNLTLDNGNNSDNSLNIKMGEVLQDDGHVKWQTAAWINHNDTWKLKTGKQSLKHFGYRVFRYAELTGLPNSITAENLKEYVNAFALRYPFDEEASGFDSSNKMLDTVWNFSKNSIKILNNDIYVDSPNRERAPYEADAYIQQLSNYQLDKGYSLARFSVDWLTYNQTWPMEWKVWSILSSWQDYLNTGDDHLIRKNYELLKAKIPKKLIDGFDSSTGLVTADYGNGGPGENNDIVDWPASLRDGYQYSNTHNVTNAFYFKGMNDLSEIANALGNKDDMKKYKLNSEISKKGIQENFFDKNTNSFKDNIGGKLHHSSQANSFVVGFGAANEEQSKAAAEFLASQGMLKGNVYSSVVALPTMIRNGQAEEAINQITGINSDGTKRNNINNWRHMIELGSGSTMEAWDESNDGTISHSHAWGTTPIIAVSQEIFGIKPIKPAYEEFEIKPIKDGLNNANLTLPTVRGEIEASFNKTSTAYNLKVKIPANTKAYVYIPGTDKDSITEGNKKAYKSEGVTYIGTADGYVKYLVGSGTYNFIAK